MNRSDRAIENIDNRPWILRHRWLMLRRTSQFGILFLFILGPWLNVWILKGSLASSVVLDTLPLSDPFLIVQVLLTGQFPQISAIVGALIILSVYLVFGGRVYCSWVCPTNLITDSAAYLQRRFGIKTAFRFPRTTRVWMLALVFILALFSGTLIWELVNPVSIVFRGLVFGLGLGWIVIVSLFLFDLFVSQRAWCGRLCPMGAFYGMIGSAGLLRINASNRNQCNDCMECYEVCPEPQVIAPVLKTRGKDETSIITNGACTNCGRCIDVCAKNVFQIDSRFGKEKIIE